MSDDASRWATFSSAFSIVLSLASARVAELGCTPVGDNPKKFVDRGGVRRLEHEAAEAAIKRVRQAAYPLVLCSASKCLSAKTAKSFWLVSVKTWLALKRR
jgi:hypothetical protein